MKQCKNCGNPLGKYAVKLGYCYDCATDMFNVDLGFQFLRQYALEHDFFLDEFWKLKTYCIDREILVKPSKDDFRAALEYDRYNDRKNLTKMLKDFCCEEKFDFWIEFLIALRDAETAA